MTEKEKRIIKSLGYTSYAMYQYIKYHPKFENKQMQWELGFSKESTYRSFNKLKKSGVITVNGYQEKRIFTINPESEWKI
jgi:hypothetical protein